MGIQINGNTNNINAGIGSLSIEDINELDIVGVATASNFKTGSSNLHSTGLTVGNALVHSTGINVGTGATVHCPSTNSLTFVHSYPVLWTLLVPVLKLDAVAIPVISSSRISSMLKEPIPALILLVFPFI